MWPFRTRERLPWIDEALQRAHVVVLELERRLGSLEAALQQLGEGIGTARAMDRRVGALEHAVRQTNASLKDDVDRITAALDVVRGMATGARGGRPRNETLEQERQLLEFARRLQGAMATPEGRAQLILELQGTSGSLPVDALGNPIRPRDQNGRPV